MIKRLFRNRYFLISSEIAFHNRTKSLDDDLGDLYSIQIVTYNLRGILTY